MNIICEYRLTEHQLNKLSPAEVYEYLNCKNQLIDTIIRKRLIEIVKIGKKDPSKVSRKDKFFFDLFIDEYTDEPITGKQQLGKLKPIYTYKFIKKSYNDKTDYDNTKENNLRILALRPDLPIYFDKIGRAHLKRTEI